MKNTAQPVVGIVMGSDSDWPTVKETAAVLDEFDVPYEVRVMSAHRTPELAAEYGSTAVKRGLKVIIAAAGGAAHLGGVLAAHTPLPVLGIPIKSSTLDGLDSLLSTVQMPSGVPVATLAVGRAGAVNAGIFAVQILATGRPALAKRLRRYKTRLKTKVRRGNERVQAELQQAGEGA